MTNDKYAVLLVDEPGRARTSVTARARTRSIGGEACWIEADEVGSEAFVAGVRTALELQTFRKRCWLASFATH